MSLFQDQQGNSLLIGMLIIAVISIAGVAGYRVLTADELASTSSNSFSSTEPENLQSSADVKRAENSLDSVDMESPDQLNQDLEQL